MLGKKHPEVGPQVKEYQRISWSQRRLLADYWEKQRRDAAAALDYARDEGRVESQQALEEARQTLAEKDQVIAENRQTLAEKEREIAELRRKLEGQ